MNFNIEDIIFTVVFVVGIIALSIVIVKIVNISKENRKSRLNVIDSKVDALNKRIDKLESR